MMLVTLTVFAQYPTVKTIKGERVVIMTVPQAEKIDQKFGKLEDSIAELNSKLQTKVQEIRVVDTKRVEADDSLQIFKTNLLTATTRIDSLNIQMKRIEKLEFVEKRTRVRVGVGLVGILTAFITFAILVIKS